MRLLVSLLTLLALLAPHTVSDTALIEIPFRRSVPLVAPIHLGATDATVVAFDLDASQRYGSVTIRPTAPCWIVTLTDSATGGEVWWDSDLYPTRPTCTAASRVALPFIVAP